MINKTNEKACKNCRFYSQHYSKQGIRFGFVSCGHCTNRNNKKMKPVLCNYWEDIALKKEERKIKAKEFMQFMSECLNEIATILKDDKES